MEFYQVEEANWALHRLQDRVSFSGWSLAIVAGLFLWALMFRLVL